jgi:hypothetical protein
VKSKADILNVRRKTGDSKMITGSWRWREDFQTNEASV